MPKKAVGGFDASGQRILNVGAPTSASDAATKSYVDSVASGGGGGGSSDAAANDLFWFGDGSDGDVTLSSGTTSLNRDTYYRNLKLSGSAILNPNGYRIFVAGNLDISNLTTGYIGYQPPANPSGSGSNGGFPSNVNPTNTVPGGLQTTSSSSQATGGSTGGTTVGSSPTQTNISIINYCFGSQYNSNSRSAGRGSSTSNIGGPARQAVTSSLPRLLNPRRPVLEFVANASIAYLHIVMSFGGGGGGGDGTNRGGGGGSGGQSGIGLLIYARTITRGASTGVATIRATGGAAGNGGSPTAGNCGGGGGGFGGPGGMVQIVCRFLAGATATACIDVSGGNGGNGGNSIGAGLAGDGGHAGPGGFVMIHTLNDGVSRIPAVVDSAASTSQSGAVANVARVDL